MQRAAMCLMGLALLGGKPVASQEQRQATHVYLAYHRIGYDNLNEWNRQYWTYSVPILEALQAEGVIEGFNQWQHETGGEYNIRFAVRTYDWASIGQFWGAYLSRLQAATPAAEWDAGGRMILAHRDEIWNIGEAHMSAEPAVSHIYESSFRHSFADGEEWNRAWSETFAPILEKAMSDGLLAGWVKLNHNTGGPDNSKVLYFFDSWDDIDDLFGTFLGTVAEQHPAVWARTSAMIRAHDDAIWVPTTRDEM